MVRLAMKEREALHKHSDGFSDVGSWVFYAVMIAVLIIALLTMVLASVAFMWDIEPPQEPVTPEATYVMRIQ